MATKGTLQEHIYLMKAACDIDKFGEIKQPCPRCGKKLLYQELKYGAYRVYCSDENCLAESFRGL